MTGKGKVIGIELFDEKNSFIMSVKKKSFVMKIERHDEPLIIIKGKELPDFDCFRQLNVVFEMANGERLKYKGRISVSTAHQLNIEIIDTNAKIMPERRTFLKIKVDAKARLMSASINSEIVTFDRSKYVQLRDINVGGVYVMTDVEFNISDVLRLRLDLEDEKVEISAEVLRVECLDGLCGIGCKFLSATHKQEEAIAKYVYRKQREERRKEILN